jgi:hypothetical protein
MNLFATNFENFSVQTLQESEIFTFNGYPSFKRGVSENFLFNKYHFNRLIKRTGSHRANVSTAARIKAI